ncbi:MAG TPA: pilin [Burkholderiales bacterium]|nr:pilin [Burkholderiales bacterium]
MPARRAGFSLIEVMVVFAIIAILALMAAPSFQDQIIRDQINKALPLADIAKTPNAVAWGMLQTFPTDNASAGLPPADKIVNDAISAVTVQDGSIHITFGNRANGVITGKILSLRAAVIEDAPIVPVTWVCGYAEPPDKMTLHGQNQTNVPAAFLPFACRSRAKK